MKTKDKAKKHIKLTLKNVILFSIIIIILLYGIIFYTKYITKNEVYAKETNAQITNNENIEISNAEKIDIDKIIEKNNNSSQKVEYTVEEIDLEYITKYNNNESLPKGTIQVIQEGREGKQEVTKKITSENGKVISEEQINSKITKAAINQIVEIGSGNYESNYKVKVGDTIYITSDRAGIMVEPSATSQKIATLMQGTKLDVISIENDWYKISGEGTIGYIKAENTTYLNKDTTSNESNSSSKNSQAKANFNINTSLNKPSGLSLEQFQKILTDSKDVNNIFKNNAQYFYYIEKQYNINGVFVAAVGIHESAWGTSKISKDKNNLFGYGAYDSNPYQGAYNFSNYSECIDLIARVLVKYYINPKGTSIYGNQKAEGTYYNGATLEGVNKRYASDKNWANSVYSYMKYLYNKL